MDRGLNAARVEMQREKVEEVDVHILNDLAIGQTTAYSRPEAIYNLE